MFLNDFVFSTKIQKKNSGRRIETWQLFLGIQLNFGELKFSVAKYSVWKVGAVEKMKENWRFGSVLHLFLYSTATLFFSYFSLFSYFFGGDHNLLVIWAFLVPNEFISSCILLLFLSHRFESNQRGKKAL